MCTQAKRAAVERERSSPQRAALTTLLSSFCVCVGVPLCNAGSREEALPAVPAVRGPSNKKKKHGSGKGKRIKA